MSNRPEHPAPGELTLGPRVVIAGTHSGVGKTTIATGLMAAFRSSGLTVGATKVGPDFIDPGYHSVAVGRPSRNLDAWMCGADRIPEIAARAGEGTDILVVEGVMGLFDGAADGSPSSTADIARIIDAPVVVVIDAAAMSGTVAAIAHGMTTFDDQLHVAGVILNRVGSDSHEALLRSALADAGIAVVGAMRRDDSLAWRDRHLGLIPVAERPAEVAESVRKLAEHVAARCDLDAIRAIASSASERTVNRSALSSKTNDHRPKVAYAVGPAFSFTYPDNLEIFASAGADLVPFDPSVDPELPDGVAGLVIGGGFPEVYAESLAGNVELLQSVRQRVADGLVVWAECGGLLWLSHSLNGHLFAGVVESDAVMTKGLTLGYRVATTTMQSPVGPAGTVIRGHEFHYSRTDPCGDGLILEGRHGRSSEGFCKPNLFATYVHVHLAGQEHLAESFVNTCRRLLPKP